MSADAIANCGATRRRVVEAMLTFGFVSVAHAASDRRAMRDYLYVNSFIYEIPGRIQRLVKAKGFRALWVFYPDGHLDVVECGLEFDFEKKRLRALLAGAVVEHGNWEKRELSSVAVSLPSSRFPQPPKAPPCKPPETFQLGRTGAGPPGLLGKALLPTVNPNMSLIAAPSLDNFEDLRRLLDRQHR